ncbi:amidophosphoribosyltransferase [Methanoplanus sp. FWC-SCC4]|uniref:Amidophosphoribosyltransferase n=1 Tax=Methanochimaera problematica TaxID=2609417 RepID=A0AA97F9C2_9EURY|nr:amidophosphoribosyltransferase [Methanoplanus sp. FWC-SCC4]WOF15200.1 amidophosphoribosyltransferase [Methanoplanus sp. FWC-SCC4]
MCGIVGIVDAGGVSFPLYYALYALQHRGQESAGITTFDGERLHKCKDQGLVADIFNADILKELKGDVGVGHVRYPTTGSKIPENIQPFNFTFQNKKISVAHNGNLTNTTELRKKFEDRGQIFCTSTDTEVIGNIIVDELRKTDKMEDAVLSCMKNLEGSYSVVIMINDKIYAFRDPLGIRPLCIGKTREGYIVCSETVAIDALNGELIRDVKPGEMLCISSEGVKCTQITEASSHGHCIFEYIYFARADSVIDGRLVYDVRRRIGESLHQEAPVDADIISPVPDSGIAHATGYSESSGIPYREGLIKNRYMGRTFIMPNQEARENAVRIKLNPVKQHLNSKSVVLVDDSIVRGTTSRRIIDIVKDAGAREVHMRIGSPPIKAPCYLGVDMPTREELIASKKTNDEVCEQIGATSLHHVSLESLIKATGIPNDDLCVGCITGEYPLCIKGEKGCPRHIEYVAGTFQSDLKDF